MAQKPVPEKTKKRVAELRGMGLTVNECAGAGGISVTSVERILAQPVYAKIASDTKKSRTSMAGSVAQVVQDLLTAVDSSGEPALHLRKIGAELYAKNPELLDAVTEDVGDELLPGVVLRFPYPGGVPRTGE